MGPNMKQLSKTDVCATVEIAWIIQHWPKAIDEVVEGMALDGFPRADAAARFSLVKAFTRSQTILIVRRATLTITAIITILW